MFIKNNCLTWVFDLTIVWYNKQMITLHYSISINTPLEKVWNTMLDDKTYREWTSVFMPGSYYDGSWEKGSIIKFLAPDEEGKLGGMLGKIAANRPHEFISIEYLGMIINGVEDTTSEEVKKWAGAHEEYSFDHTNGVTEVHVTLDLAEDMADMFNESWPKALTKLKDLCEK